MEQKSARNFIVVYMRCGASSGDVGRLKIGLSPATVVRFAEEGIFQRGIIPVCTKEIRFGADEFMGFGGK